MAKQRYINTKFWSDNWVIELDPLERYLFLYFLTNEHTNIAGIYEIPMRNVVMETGMTKEQIEDALKKFSKAEKIHYKEGWVVIPNFLKHQNWKSPQVAKGIKAELEHIPEVLRQYLYGIEAISHLNLNSNSNSDLDSKHPPISEQIKSDKFQALLKELAEIDYLSLGQLTREAEEKFAPHWDEKGEGQKKSRWQKESTFDVYLRYRKWVGNLHTWRKDVKCRAAGKWHRAGDTCHHGKQEPEVDYKKLPPSAAAKELAKGMRI